MTQFETRVVVGNSFAFVMQGPDPFCIHQAIRVYDLACRVHKGATVTLYAESANTDPLVLAQQCA